jgi:hypothetical protein
LGVRNGRCQSHSQIFIVSKEMRDRNRSHQHCLDTYACLLRVSYIVGLRGRRRKYGIEKLDCLVNRYSRRSCLFCSCLRRATDLDKLVMKAKYFGRQKLKRHVTVLTTCLQVNRRSNVILCLKESSLELCNVLLHKFPLNTDTHRKQDISKPCF